MYESDFDHTLLLVTKFICTDYITVKSTMVGNNTSYR